jgi:hypothetical protein
VNIEPGDEEQIDDLEGAVFSVNDRGAALRRVRQHFRVVDSKRLPVSQSQ